MKGIVYRQNAGFEPLVLNTIFSGARGWERQILAGNVLQTLIFPIKSPEACIIIEKHKRVL